VRAGAALLGALVMLAAAACTPSATGQLTVYAAASMTNVTGPLATAWAADHPAVGLTFATGSSAALRVQIEQGAPADVFLSADLANAQALVDDGLANGPVDSFAGNSLAVVVPAGNPAGIATPADLARPGVCIIAAGPNVPVTVYAEQAVALLAGLRGYGAEFPGRYEANVCSREDNVAAVVGKVQLGEGDAAIVYATDATAATDLTTIPIPAAANVVAEYGAVVVQASSSAGLAGNFLTWLTGEQGQRGEHRGGARNRHPDTG
jgi:molybdate transport system substrate-binding protein